jgi:diguanylate cyclase (GGDEF)-like protein
MAASDQNPCLDPLSREGFACLSAPAVRQRLDEEIARAQRLGTSVSCLVLVVANLEEVALEHGSDLSEQTLAYIGAALQRQLRRFDRIGRTGAEELLIVLPGADRRRGESVARRVLQRVHAIKVEAGGRRRPLELSVGLAPWRDDASAEDMVERARAATRRLNGNGNGNGPPSPFAPPGGATAPGRGAPRRGLGGFEPRPRPA